MDLYNDVLNLEDNKEEPIFPHKGNFLKYVLFSGIPQVKVLLTVETSVNDNIFLIHLYDGEERVKGFRVKKNNLNLYVINELLTGYWMDLRDKNANC